MSRSSERVEAEVEQSRDRLNRTLDDLQSRLKSSGFGEHLTALDWRTASLNGSARDLISVSRRNPVPVLMICAGAGWLLFAALGRVMREDRRSRPRLRERGTSAANASVVRPKADHQEGALDEALEETFPGSDPVSVRITK